MSIADKVAALQARLNAPLTAWRETQMPRQALSPAIMSGAGLRAGLQLHVAAEAELTGHLSSPRDRLLELEVQNTRPGAWFGLHLPLDLPDLSDVAWLGFAARSNASQVMALRVCLRSGLGPDHGFQDLFFDRHVLSQAGQSDHLDMIAPNQQPELPLQAPWREMILFLPPDQSFDWALQDLRFFVL
ncbi:MAG: hypothetical protein ACJASV_000919 [Pseudorhodobacter sp.]